MGLATCRAIIGTHGGSIHAARAESRGLSIVIALPQSVTYFLDAPSTVDPTKVKIEIQAPPTDDAAPPVFK